MELSSEKTLSRKKSTSERAQRQASPTAPLLFIGTAAWTIPKDFSQHFPNKGTHLERYAQRLSGVEINSSFYRDHQAKTYQRWAQSTPENFRFSVKLSRDITHIKRLEVSLEEIEEKILPLRELKEKWGVLLVQLPPSLSFHKRIVEQFFENLRELVSVPIAIEPRHATWTSSQACQLLKNFQISKVIADPPVCEPAKPSEFLHGDLVYLRLHGSPEIYRSRYPTETLQNVRRELEHYRLRYSNVWCIFDNTTFGFATDNACELSLPYQAQQTAT